VSAGGWADGVAVIPELGFQIVCRYVDSADTVLAEAALGALAWTDHPSEALPLLLAHAADDRARVALHAATRVTAFDVRDAALALTTAVE
jgi:hypothetical protein